MNGLIDLDLDFRNGDLMPISVKALEDAIKLANELSQRYEKLTLWQRTNSRKVKIIEYRKS